MIVSVGQYLAKERIIKITYLFIRNTRASIHYLNNQLFRMPWFMIYIEGNFSVSCGNDRIIQQQRKYFT